MWTSRASWSAMHAGSFLCSSSHRGSSGVIHGHCRCWSSQRASILRAPPKTQGSHVVPEEAVYPEPSP